MTRHSPALVVVMLCGLLATATYAAEEKVTGWRGDWTGRYPDANPPTSWYRRPKSPAYGLRCQAAKPKPGDSGVAAKPVWAGDVNEWLTLGAFEVRDFAAALDEPFLPDEAAVEPAEGDKVGENAWQSLILPHYQERVRDRPGGLLADGGGEAGRS